MEDFINQHLLTLMIFVPALGALVVAMLPSNANNAIKLVSLIFALIPLGLCVPLMQKFNPQMAYGTYEFVTNVPWIDAFNIHYFVGVDGLSVTMVVLTALLSFICIIASWGFEDWKVHRGIKGYFALFLLLEAGMMGVFCSLDFFLFYVFWEVMLLPMYFLIGIWGGARREYAAIKFFLYTLVGSVLMLVVMLALYFNTTDANGDHTFSMVEMMNNSSAFTGTWWKAAFIGLFIGFAIKVPAFPFHTWLPDAHVEAPTPVSVILAAVLLKMGIYGIFRICYPILPEASLWFAPFMMFLGMVNIIYGAMCALAQIRGVRRVDRKTGEVSIEKDWKKMIAYSSVSHMGFCMIGMASMTSEGFNGALFQMWNHGCITGMLFLLVGVVYDRAHHRDIQGFGGLWTKMPKFGVLTALAFMASLGLPGLSGFVSEVLCFVGAFISESEKMVTLSILGWTIFEVPHYLFFRILTGISVFGVVLGAAYFLWSYEKVFLGSLNEKYKDITDINGREKVTIWPLALIVVGLGIYPSIYLDQVKPFMDALAKAMTG